MLHARSCVRGWHRELQRSLPRDAYGLILHAKVVQGAHSITASWSDYTCQRTIMNLPAQRRARVEACSIISSRTNCVQSASVWRATLTLLNGCASAKPMLTGYRQGFFGHALVSVSRHHLQNFTKNCSRERHCIPSRERHFRPSSKQRTHTWLPGPLGNAS